MKKVLLISFILVFTFSCKTVQLTDGTYITKRQEKKIYKKVFNDTFGQMTYEEIELMSDVNFTVDTGKVNTNERVLKVFIDTAYFEEPSFTVYKQLEYSEGDSATLYDSDLFILNGVDYINFDTTVWKNYRIIEIYR